MEMTLMSSERRRVPAMLEEAMAKREKLRDCQFGGTVPQCEMSAAPLGGADANRMLPLFDRLFAWCHGTADTGSRGEALAAEWLVRHRRFTVIARNWHNPRDRREEIDLVCLDGEILVFVEVKTRRAEALVSGYFAVDRRKKRALHRAARAYLARLEKRPHTFRCDVVEVALPQGGGEPEVRHFENVSLFSKHYH